MTDLEMQRKTIESWIEKNTSSGLMEDDERLKKLMECLKANMVEDHEDLTLDNTEAFTRLDEILKKSKT